MATLFDPAVADHLKNEVDQARIKMRHVAPRSVQFWKIVLHSSTGQATESVQIDLCVDGTCTVRRCERAADG